MFSAVCVPVCTTVSPPERIGLHKQLSVREWPKDVASDVGVQASRSALLHYSRQTKAQASRWQVFQETPTWRRVYGTYVEKPIILLLFSNFITNDYNLWYFSLT